MGTYSEDLSGILSDAGSIAKKSQPGDMRIQITIAHFMAALAERQNLQITRQMVEFGFRFPNPR
jgi:hypothetical protein